MELLTGGDKLTLAVELTLRRLGISGTLHGMWYLTYAIGRTVEDPQYVRYITKRVYLDVAKAYHSTPSRVERAMRFAIHSCWANEEVKKEFEQMTGYHLLRCPTNSEFIDLVAFYIRHR